MKDARGEKRLKMLSRWTIELDRSLTAVMALLVFAACNSSKSSPSLIGPSPSPTSQAPTATIDSPSDGSTFTSGDTITFQGSATDPNDGDLSGSSLVWTSNLDGRIGTGGSVKDSKLSVGTHTITLEATDSRGATDSARVSISVTAAPEQRLAFASDRGGWFSIYTIGLDGSGLQQITDPTSLAHDDSPAWSTDGQRIAYESVLLDPLGDHSTLRSVGPDGSGDIELNSDGSAAAWSPSGDSIATVITNLLQLSTNIAVLSRHGSTPRIVLNLTAIPNNDVATAQFAGEGWTPDTTGALLLGKHEQLLVFEMYSQLDCAPNYHHGIWITDLSGSMLQFFPAICQLGGDDAGPVISPDGTKLAFAADPTGEYDIYVADFEAGTLTPITNDPANDLDPSWSPDGTRIAFASERDGQVEIFVMNADGSGVARVTHDPDHQDRWPTWSPGP